MAPLPLRYLFALWTVGLLACVGAGAWVATSTADVRLWHYGALAGAVLAPLLVGGYCRSFAVGPSGATGASRH